MYHPEGIAYPNPCNRAANCTILWKGWVISRGTKIFGCPRHLWGRDFAFWLLSLIPFLKFRSTSLPLRISSHLYLFISWKNSSRTSYTPSPVSLGKYIHQYVHLPEEIPTSMSLGLFKRSSHRWFFDQYSYTANT